MTPILKIIATIPWAFMLIFFVSLMFWGNVSRNGVKRPLGIPGRIFSAILAIFTWYILVSIYQ